MRLIMLLNIFLGADAYDTVFQQGLAHLDAQHYAEAAQSFEQLVGEGVHTAPLFYNLGLAYHHAGEKGAALANYERALRLEPDMAAAQDNQKLLLASLERQQAPPMPPAWQEALLFWHKGLGYATVWRVAAVAWCVFWILLILRRWRPVPHLASAAAVLGLVAVMCALSAWVKAHPIPLAVAVTSATPVYYGINDTGAVRFELFEGQRVKVEDRREDWLRIRSAEGDGWVQSVNFIELGPPYEAWQPIAKADSTTPPQSGNAVTGAREL